MNRRSFSCRLRGGAALLLLASLALHAAFPRLAWAACANLDLLACGDNIEYSFYYGIASIAWNVNRWLLILAYQLDQLRAWLVTVAFSGAYQWLTSFVQPVYIPIATAALMLAAILFMLVPLTGETGVVNMRHVMVWAVMTPVVLTIGGQLIGQAEQVRSDISAHLFTEMSRATPGAIFGSPGSDMPAPVALYPSNPCGTTLARTTTTGIAMDSLAAALMYADAGDIHCPDVRGPSRDIPDGMYNSPPAFAFDGSVGDLDSSVERRGWVEGLQRGMNRLLQGIIASFLAVLESLIHLVFSLSMAVLWLSLPIGLIFVWFQQTASPISSVLRRAASVLISSWMASIVMGVLSAALLAAAQLGNAGAFTGLALGGLFLMLYLTVLAFATLWKSIGTVEQTALGVAGVSFTQPVQTAAQLAGAVATGGASTLAIGGMALAQSKDAPLTERAVYTTGALIGRLPGGGAVGEVAAAMGWLHTEGALYEGIYAGDRSHHSWRSSRLQMERDHGGYGRTTTGASSRGGSGALGGGGSAPAPPSAGGPSGGGSPAPAPVTPITPAPNPAAPSPGPAQAAAPTSIGTAPVVPTPGPAQAAARAPIAPTTGPAVAGTAAPGAVAAAAAPGAAAAAGASPQAGGVALTPLPPTSFHAAYAAAQVGSLPNPATGADWQYLGSVPTATGYRHAFQHPAHPITGRPELRWVESTAADVAPAHSVPTRRFP